MLKLDGNGRPRKTKPGVSHFKTKHSKSKRRSHRSGTKMWSPMTRTAKGKTKGWDPLTRRASKSKTKQWDPLSRASKSKTKQWDPLSRSKRQDNEKEIHDSGWWVWIVILVLVVIIAGAAILFFSTRGSAREGTGKPVHTPSSQEDDGSKVPAPQSYFTWGAVAKIMLGAGVLGAVYYWIAPLIWPEVILVHENGKDVLQKKNGNTEIVVYTTDGKTILPLGRHWVDSNDPSVDGETRWKGIEDSVERRGSGGKIIKNGTSHIYFKDKLLPGAFCEWKRNHKTAPNAKGQTVHTIEWTDHKRCGDKEDWQKWYKSDQSTKDETISGVTNWNNTDVVFKNKDDVLKNSGWKWMAE